MKKYVTRSLKIQRLHRSGPPVPHIHLAGHWLADLGFQVGEQVSVTTCERLLIIEPLDMEAAHQAVLKEIHRQRKALGPWKSTR